MGILASAIPTMASGAAPLPGFLNSLAGPLDHYGYGAIALLLLLENIGVPVVPGELALIGGAIFAGTGRAGLNVVLVGVVAVVVTIAGAEIGYLIGKYAGRWSSPAISSGCAKPTGSSRASPRCAGSRS
jgi:membrane protein DedA with SNARE-associated domain